MIKTNKNKGSNLLFRLLLTGLANLPFSVSRLFARFLAQLFWLSHSPLRKVTEVNLALCFPQMDEVERSILAKQFILEFIRTALDMPRIWFNEGMFGPGNVAEIQGKEHLDQALLEGHGVIVILPHLGHWEYFGMYLGQYYPCRVLYNPIDSIVSGNLEETIKQARMRTGVALSPADAQGVKQVLKALKRGELALIAPDQIPNDRSSTVFAPFFAESAPTMTLITNLLQKTKSRAVIGFAKRLKCGRYELVFKPVDKAIYSENINEALAGLNRSVENMIAEAPAQYLWSYKRFRIGVNGRRDVYKM